MNRIIRNLVIAAPLVLVGITAAPAAAMAEGFDIAIPEPKPEPPKDIAIPKPDPKPDFPLADAPKPQAPKPGANPQSNPQGALAADEAVKVEKKKAKKVVSAKGSPDSIDRSEDLFANEAFETELVVAEDTDGGLDLAWLLVGGGIVTASGLAFAARKRSNA